MNPKKSTPNREEITEARNNVIRLENRLETLAGAGKYGTQLYRDIKAAWMFWNDTLNDICTPIV